MFSTKWQEIHNEEDGFPTHHQLENLGETTSLWGGLLKDNCHGFLLDQLKIPRVWTRSKKIATCFLLDQLKINKK